MTVEYKCIDVYKKPENPMEWLPCPRCGLRPLVWEFDNGRVTAWGCCLLSSGGQSRASNTVTSNSPHASLYLETTERRGQGGQKQTHNEKSILIYQYGILVIKLRSGKVSGNRLCLSRDSITL